MALASLIGYGLAAAGLAPVEAMRRRATEVSLRSDDERLTGCAGRSSESVASWLTPATSSALLAVLKTELEGALRTGAHGPQVREALVAAVEECDHLTQLAEDLLLVAQAADGRRRSTATCSGRATCSPACASASPTAPPSTGAASRSNAPEDLTVGGDPLRLRQALSNLLDNALRHGEGHVLLAARGGGRAVELEVSDEGPGFLSDIAGRAFERFSRGDAARGRSGTGLGLAIVRAVAEAHGARRRSSPARGRPYASRSRRRRRAIPRRAARAATPFEPRSLSHGDISRRT